MNCLKEDALNELRGLVVATPSRGSGSPAKGPAGGPAVCNRGQLTINALIQRIKIHQHSSKYFFLYY